MNYFRKMIMLPTDEFNKYKNLLYSAQVTPETNPMQQELKNIKEVHGTTLPDDQRAKLEAEIIQRYSTKNERKESEVAKIDPSQIEWIRNSIKHFSNSNKSRANRLYEYLFTRLQNRWNENGELLTADGNNIRGSNILDLINFVTSTVKQRNIPIGFSDFIIMLGEANTPTHMFSNHGMNHINENKQDESVEQIVVQTPKKLKREKRRASMKWNNYE